MGVPVVRDENGIRWITFERPEVLNALTLDDLRAIRVAVESADASVRAIAFTGAGDRAFSAGMHLDVFKDADPAAGCELIEQVGACVGAVRLTPVPTLAMVNGYCLGAAFELALACDLRTAHPDVRFGLPEVKLGIPSAVDAALLQDHVGLSKAREVILTGDLYASADLTPGLVNRLVPRERLRSATDELLAAVTAHTREVLAAQKTLFETWLNAPLAEAIETSKDIFGAVFAQPATRAAIERYRDA
jgi:enoyl-CoA hydratase